MAAWRGPRSPHQTETAFTDRIEDDEKQKLCHALGDCQGEAGGLQIQECRVFGLRSLLRSKFVVGSFRPSTSFRKASRGGYLVKKKRLSTKLTPRDDGVDGGGDGEAREKLLRQEHRLESTTGAIIEDGEVVRKLLRQELEQAPNNLQAHIHANVNSDVFTLRSGVGTLYQWIVSVLRCFFCTSSSYSISASGENTGHDEAKSDRQRPEEARVQRSIIQLKGKDHLSDVDPTNLVSTVFQCTDQSVNILDTHAEVISNSESEEVISNSESEEMITLNLGGPEVLGGLSLLGYKHVVFSVCPASLVDPELE